MIGLNFVTICSGKELVAKSKAWSHTTFFTLATWVTWATWPTWATLFTCY